jgi:hypothetical protein
MTRQIVDLVVYEDQKREPLGISGTGLPHPKDFGLNPIPMGTACWRGFYCEYAIRQNHLRLTHLVVRNDGEYPPITGVTALYEDAYILNDGEDEPEPLVGRSVGTIVGSPDKSKIGHRQVQYDGGIYAGLNVPAPLTGGILWGINDINVPYIQIHLNNLISSSVILELLFENGMLVKTIDHSVVVAAKREEVLGMKHPDFRSPEYAPFEANIEAWIRSTLSLDYRFF